MTENMAGRGEGLAGLIERVISAGDDLRYDEYGVMEMPTGHLATKWDIAKKELQTALEAAAPPGTPRVPDELVREIIADALIGSHGYGGSLSRARMDISNRIEKWLAALKYYASHADGGTGVAEAALATPSPQAPHNEISLVRLVLSAHQTAYAKFHNGEGRGVIEADQMAIGYASVELAKALKEQR